MSPSATLDLGDLTPWDRMRLAKMALIRDEEKEMENHRAKRISGRHSRDSIISSTSSLFDMSNHASGSSHRDSLAPSSILRRPSSTSYEDPSEGSSSRSTSSFGHVGSFYESYADSPTSPRRPSSRRRSSRVRFSDDANMHLDDRASFDSISSTPPSFALRASRSSTYPSIPGSDFAPRAISYTRTYTQMSTTSLSSTDDIPWDDSANFASSHTALRDVLERSSLSEATGLYYSGAYYSRSDSLDGSIGHPADYAYHSLLPSAPRTPPPDRIPTLNRFDWFEAGLSPRSDPNSLPTVGSLGGIACLPPHADQIDPLDTVDPFTLAPYSPQSSLSAVSLEHEDSSSRRNSNASSLNPGSRRSSYNVKRASVDSTTGNSLLFPCTPSRKTIPAQTEIYLDTPQSTHVSCFPNASFSPTLSQIMPEEANADGEDREDLRKTEPIDTKIERSENGDGPHRPSIRPLSSCPSDLSSASTTSSVESLGPATPAESAECQMPISARSPDIRDLDASFASFQMRVPMPKPTRHAEGWGRVEILKPGNAEDTESAQKIMDKEIRLSAFLKEGVPPLMKDGRCGMSPNRWFALLQDEVPPTSECSFYMYDHRFH